MISILIILKEFTDYILNLIYYESETILWKKYILDYKL
jgi:hypothetical protein